MCRTVKVCNPSCRQLRKSGRRRCSTWLASKDAYCILTPGLLWSFTVCHLLRRSVTNLSAEKVAGVTVAPGLSWYPTMTLGDEKASRRSTCRKHEALLTKLRVGSYTTPPSNPDGGGLSNNRRRHNQTWELRRRFLFLTSHKP